MTLGQNIFLPASTVYVKERLSLIAFTATWQFEPTKQEFVSPNKYFKTEENFNLPHMSYVELVTSRIQ
jgi:hypothetical protein